MTEQLLRLGRLESATVTHHPAPAGVRTTVRCAVVDGRAGFRPRRSNRVRPIDECGAVRPELQELIVDGRFDGVDEVTLRYGSGTGQRMVIVNGAVDGVRVPDGVEVVDRGSPGQAAIHHRVGGRDWRVSPDSFFQTSDRGVVALIGAVAELLAPEGSVVDLYAGVGVLGGVAAGDRLVAAVESAPSSVLDARHNLGPDVVVFDTKVDRWEPDLAAISADSVIADPARRGLQAAGVAAIRRLGAGEVVLVSCDPASLGRDTALLSEAGWQHDRSVVIDMFPDTSRVEVVSRFAR